MTSTQRKGNARCGPLFGPAAGSKPDQAEIVAYCRERLARFKCPTSIDLIEVLPRNPSGKILKTELREPYWPGRTRRVN